MKTEKLFFNEQTQELIRYGISISDGVWYAVEFKVGNKFRRYTYSNPEEYANYYTEVHELRDFTNIVDIFYELYKK